MTRVRWLRAEWPDSIRALATKLKANQFTREGLDGFIIERVRDTFIEARYIQKLSYQETITDPFGADVVFDRTEYRTTNFTLYSAFPHIEVRDPPRNLNEFLNKLQEICNFSATVAPVSVNILDWAARFQKVVGQKIIVDSLQVSGLVLENGITAKILISGEKDVRGALQAVLENRMSTLDKLQMRCSSGSKLVPIQLSTSGTAKIPDDHLHFFLPMLQQSLPTKAKLKSNVAFR